MAHGWSALAACGLLLLAGCIQIEVTPAGAGTHGQAVAASAEATPRDKYAVACILLGANGNALHAGSCEYRFGALGATAQVDADGKAVRLVPAGATGTVTGSAPGHAAARATLTVDRDKTVRMTLPELPAGQQPGGATAPADGNGTGSPQAAVQEAGDNATTAPQVFEPKLLVLLDEVYVLAPAELPDTTYTFEVPEGVDTLELVGTYQYAPFATLPDVRLYGPDGSEVGRHTRLLYSPYPSVGAAKEIPMVYVLDPAPGQYRLAAGGASTTPVNLVATAYTGTALDFSFTPLGGSPRTLSSFQGQVVLVDLMATWCGPCHDAMPGLKALAAEYGDRLTILSVDIDEAETQQELAAMRDQYRADWLWGFEDGGSASSAYGSGYIPTFAIVDARGGLVYRQVGAVDHDLARQLIDAALERGGA